MSPTGDADVTICIRTGAQQFWFLRVLPLNALSLKFLTNVTKCGRRKDTRQGSSNRLVKGITAAYLAIKQAQQGDTLEKVEVADFSRQVDSLPPVLDLRRAGYGACC